MRKQIDFELWCEEQRDDDTAAYQKNEYHYDHVIEIYEENKATDQIKLQLMNLVNTYHFDLINQAIRELGWIKGIKRAEIKRKVAA